MVKGEYATLGFVSYLKKPPAEENSVIVDMLLDAGAVLYVKTNVPQTLFACAPYLVFYENCRRTNSCASVPLSSCNLDL
jgi:hypothetical protein